MTIIVALLSVGIWYYKVEYKDALSKSYNAEIRENGKQELFEDIYDNDEKESSDLSVEEISKEIDMSK
jgi:malate/lactate dehydrogenase